VFAVHVHGDHKVHEARVTETLTLIFEQLHGDIDFGCTAQVSRRNPGMQPTRNDRAETSNSSGVLSLWELAASSRSVLRATGRQGRGGWFLDWYLFCILSQRRDQGTRHNRDRVPSDVRRWNQDGRPVRALMRCM
jgi:hypothetical protein